MLEIIIDNLFRVAILVCAVVVLHSNAATIKSNREMIEHYKLVVLDNKKRIKSNREHKAAVEKLLKKMEGE